MRWPMRRSSTSPPTASSTPSAATVLATLVLTPGEDDRADDDGFLRLDEIHELRLDANLAILSACDTSVGRTIGTEGTLALSRGFLAAGARRVVATLWPVSDASTAQLVGSLFDPHLPTDLPVSKRLTEAKRALRAETSHAHPFYWAAFVLSGRR